MNKVSNKGKGPGAPRKPRGALEQAHSPKPLNQAQGEPDEIDLSAAVPKTHPGGTKQLSSPKNHPHKRNININNGSLLDDDSLLININAVSIKDALTAKELKFLELYLSGEHTIEKAMKTAGYEGYNEKYLYRLSRKIIEKYESREGDHRKIMRALGWGEVKIIMSLIHAATKFKSETVRLNALIALAKCAGLQKEILEGPGGVKILVLCGQGGEGKEETAPGERQPQPITIAPVKPLQITK